MVEKSEVKNKCNCFGTLGQFEGDMDFHEMGIEGCRRHGCRKDPVELIANKINALEAYITERELCKNPDMTPYVVSHEETMAFLNGWDAAMKAK